MVGERGGGGEGKGGLLQPPPRARRDGGWGLEGGVVSPHRRGNHPEVLYPRTLSWLPEPSERASGSARGRDPNRAPSRRMDRHESTRKIHKGPSANRVFRQAVPDLVLRENRLWFFQLRIVMETRLQMFNFGFYLQLSIGLPERTKWNALEQKNTAPGKT